MLTVESIPESLPYLRDVVLSFITQRFQPDHIDAQLFKMYGHKVADIPSLPFERQKTINDRIARWQG